MKYQEIQELNLKNYKLLNKDFNFRQIIINHILIISNIIIIIKHLQYQWLAVIDDRLKVNCEISQKSTTINFGREFWMTQIIQIFLAGLKKNHKRGFKVLIIDNQIRSQYYIAGSQNVVESKSLININQKTDEFVDLEGTPQNLIYGVSKISNFYGALMIQLGQFQYQQEKPGVGISQIDITLGLIQNDGMLCPLGYYEYNFNGISLLCVKVLVVLNLGKKLSLQRVGKDGMENLRLIERIQRLMMLIAFKIFNYIQKHEDSLIRCIENNILFKQLKLIHDYSYQMFYLWKVGHLWNDYVQLLQDGVTTGESLDRLGLERYCCRRMILTHVDLIDKLLNYNIYKTL
ncbi:unnamed protein product [Paramecium primaurelia]|uniref:DNA-directed RNA polymerases I, II, and III subunit RPABC5 n=1 Tax=Paramecium primaurelia TaxID=5886 RepID=A0A8S1LG19_PARPR|nr:unnamed protein product [Paramecium primaurelia]